LELLAALPTLAVLDSSAVLEEYVFLTFPEHAHQTATARTTTPVGYLAFASRRGSTHARHRQSVAPDASVASLESVLSRLRELVVQQMTVQVVFFAASVVSASLN
jgi:hypothetical protein